VFIITTGGVGPTFDDMTLKAVAKALNMRLTLSRAAVAMMRAHYARRFPNRKLTLTKPRLKMARIPNGAVPIQNPAGTAPAVLIVVKGTRIFWLPGVPNEAKAIFHESIAPAIRVSSGGFVFAERWLEVQGIMESSLAPTIDRVMTRWPGVYIKSHPRGIETGGRPHIDLHFSITAQDSRRAKKHVLSASRDLAQRLRAVGARITLKK